MYDKYSKKQLEELRERILYWKRNPDMLVEWLFGYKLPWYKKIWLILFSRITVKDNKKSTENNIYFKIHCLYNAKTEIYNRTLTDMRDRYDPTSAYTGYSYEVRNASNLYAHYLCLWCRKKIIQETGHSFDVYKWKDSISGYWNLSAQGWIDLYEYLVENGEIEEI